MTETWHGNIPVLTNQIINDVPDIAEDLLYLGRRFGYICDPSETDQGAAGSGRSLKDHLTTIGTSKYAVIFFPHHAADGNSTTYTLTTTLDMTSYPYVYLVFQPGARLVIGAAATFTAYAHSNILAGAFQIFTATGTLAFYSTAGIRYPEWDATGTSQAAISGFYGTGRATFTYNGGSSAYTVLVSGARYLCSDKDASWVSSLTSRALTADVASPVASTWYYLYIDYSAIRSGTAVTNTELIWSATPPAYSHSLRGWYNGSDRCIFSAMTNATPNNLTEFFHDGGDLVTFADKVENLAATDLAGDAWTDVTCTAPGFCGKVLLTGQIEQTSGVSEWAWRKNGQTGSTGHSIGGYVDGSFSINPYFQFTAITDTSQIIEINKVEPSTATSNTIAVWTDGWYFPGGM